MGIILPFKPVQKDEESLTKEDSYSFSEDIENNRKNEERKAEDRAKANQQVKKSYKLTK